MNWFSKSFNIFNKSKTKTEQKEFSGLMFPAGVFSTNGGNIQTLSYEGYVLNSCVHSAVNLQINAITQNNLVVCNKDDEESEPIENELSLLLKNPDPDENDGLVDWLTEYFGYHLLFGNSLIYKLATENGLNVGKPQMLKVLSQAQIKIITKETLFGKQLDRYEWANNSKVPIKKEDIMLGKTFNPTNQVVGLTPLMACGFNVDLINEVMRWNIALLQNGVNPAGIYTVPGELTEQSFRRMKSQMDENSGSKNAGREKVMEGGMTYQQTGLSPKDTDFTTGILNAKREVAAVYNIAPQLIGDTASSTFANYEQAVLSLHNDVAYPLLNGLVTKLNNWITPFFGEELIIKIDQSKVAAIQEQKKKEFEKTDKSVSLTVNEKRNAQGRDSVANGDVIIINGQTLDQIIAGVPVTQPAPFKKSNTKKISKQFYFDTQLKTIDKNTDNAINESKNLISDYFSFQLKEINDNLKGIHSTTQFQHAVDAVVQQTSPLLKEVYNKIYKDICFDYTLKAMKSFRQEIQKELGLESKEEGKPIAPYSSFLAGAGIGFQVNILDRFKTEFGSYVDKYFSQIKLGDLIVGMDDTTKAMVASVVQTGVKNGDSIGMIQKSINELYDNSMTDWRAETIARTETARGMGYAEHESQKKISPTSEKKWMATHDNRTRPTAKGGGEYNHRNADYINGFIPIDQPFTVSNEKMMFPSDISLGASAGNTINCRCSVGYLDQEFAEFFE